MTMTLKSRLERFTRIDSATGCHIWIGMKNNDGYGLLRVNGRRLMAHRLSYEEFVGPIPNGLCVLHNCPYGDNPSCVNPQHLWIGTKADNNTDRYIKGRSAFGRKNGAHTHPEKIARGNNHWSKRFPEKYQRGDNHHSRKHPERLARGKRNGAHTRPEKVLRGEKHGSSKLTTEQVIEIRNRYLLGGISYKKLALEYNVQSPLIYKIVKRRIWKHVP